jgi:hypothetical protein
METARWCLDRVICLTPAMAVGRACRTGVHKERRTVQLRNRGGVEGCKPVYLNQSMHRKALRAAV